MRHCHYQESTLVMHTEKCHNIICHSIWLDEKEEKNSILIFAASTTDFNCTNIKSQ